MGKDEASSPISEATSGEPTSRILFVDDEPLVLRSLKRATALSSKRWQAVFVGGGTAALDRLAEGDIDVVVSDMQMPEMDGAELLTRVQERHPDVVRIVLSGHADPRLAFRAVPVAHQFLTKPFDAHHLVRTLDRALALRALIGSADLRAVVGRDNRLPSAPRTYTALTRLLAKDDVSMRDVVAVIERDPALSARVAQLSASGFFRVPRTINTIAGYASYLGIDVIKTLVLTVELANTFGMGSVVPAGFSMDELERHSLLVGNLARRMVTDREDMEHAFIAGLLHEVGRLVLASRRPQDYARAVLNGGSEGQRLHQAERELFGSTHAEVGAYLLGLWGLPLEIVDAVASHHDPERLAWQGKVDVPMAVHLANVLAHDPDAPLAAPEIAGAPSTARGEGSAVYRLVAESTNIERWRISAHELLSGGNVAGGRGA
jgi:putative nucleotidyltransferase with HDIG domain